MALVMSRPIKDKNTGIYRSKPRVPRDLVDKIRGQRLTFPVGDTLQTIRAGEFVEFSLRTKDERQAKERHSKAMAALEHLWKAQREGAKALTHKEAVALSGVIYRETVSQAEADTSLSHLHTIEAIAAELEAADTPKKLEAVCLSIARNTGPALLPLVVERSQFNALGLQLDWYEILETTFGKITDSVLTREGLVINSQSRMMLLDAIRDAAVDAVHRVARNTKGDYSPDPKEQRFPALSSASGVTKGLTFKSLFDDYKNFSGKRGQRAPATIAAYEKTVLQELPAFLSKTFQHRDPARLTLIQMVAWRDHLLKSGLSPKTVKDKKIAAVKAVLERATRDGKLLHNPAAKVDVSVPQRIVTRLKGFTDEEAQAILTAALRFTGGRHAKETVAAIRWTPWLGAYSGARIVELTQLRKGDIMETPEGWFMRLTPEAGSIKTGQYRDVPIHSHLIELGFLKFVEVARAGPLFYRVPSADKVDVEQARVVSQRVSDWVRKEVGIVDQRVQPTHGWRHRFKTVARAVGMDSEARDYIPGHKIPGMGAVYGDMAGLHREIEKLPRYRTG